MDQRSFPLGLLCFSLVLLSCKKEGTNASKDLSPRNTREVVWQEIAKISEKSKFSKIDTLEVNQNIDDGIITVAKLRETFTPLGDGVPIAGDEYTEETYFAGSANVSCSYSFTGTFWDLKSRGYPSIYTISWGTGGSSGSHHLSYDGYDPIATYTFTSTGVGGNCTSASGYGNLEENIFGFHRNWTVETAVNQVAPNLWRAYISLTKV